MGKNLNKPNILMFAPACFPPVNPEGIVNSKLTLAMHDANWNVDVITKAGVRNLYLAKDYEDWTPLPDLIQSIVVPSRWSPRSVLFKLRGMIQTGHNARYIDWVSQAISVGCHLASKKHYDFILSRANPYATHLAALYISRKFNLPWIANWNDAYPIEKYPPPYGQGSGAKIHNNINKAYNTIVSHASWHTFPCERLRNHICSYLPQSEKVKTNSSIVPHIAIKRFKKTSTNKSSKFVLYHAGDFGPPRDSGAFLDGVARFVKQTGAGGSVLIKFIGINHNPVDFEDKIHEFGLNSIVSFEGSKSYVDSLECLSQADVSVIVEAPCPEGIFLPSKFVDYVQTGRPILAVSPSVGTLADILDKYGGGIAADIHSPQAISRAIEQLYNHWKANTLNSTYSSSKLYEMFSEKRILSNYTEIFERISH